MTDMCSLKKCSIKSKDILTIFWRGTMEHNTILTQMVDYQKTMFNSYFAMMTLFQDQSCQMMNKASEKNPLWQEDNKIIRNYWIEFVKQNQKNCKEYIDNSFDRIKEIFITPEPVPKPDSKTKKAA